jgi:hypothetical protein
MKSEHSFIQELEDRAGEQQRLVQTELIPTWAKGLGDWLAVNPWRVLVPLSGTMYLLIRILLGIEYREFILGLFGGFAR